MCSASWRAFFGTALKSKSLEITPTSYLATPWRARDHPSGFDEADTKKN